MPSTDRKLELKAKTSMAQTASQVAVYAKGLKNELGKRVEISGKYRTVCSSVWVRISVAELTICFS
jgi:hypothetical protein